MHARFALLRRCLIPPQIVAGMLLAVPTLLLRQAGWALEVDPTVQQVSMVALFTSIGFTLDGDALRRGGPPAAIVLGMFVIGSVIQNCVGVALAVLQGVHPLIGIAVGGISLAGGPATSLAFGPTLESAGAVGATSVALAACIAGILIASLTTGSLGALLIEHDRLPYPVDALPFEAHPVPANDGERQAPFLTTLVLFGIAMGVGFLVNLALNRALRSLAVAFPATVGAMLIAALMRTLSKRVALFRIPDRQIEEVGSVALSWFIPLALWTLRYWDLPNLARPAAVILLAQFPVTVALAWVTYRLVGKTFDSALMASGYFGYMYGTMANSLAAMRELEMRFGPSPRAFLVVLISGGVLSDLTNVVAIALSRAAVAAWLR